jgi:uridine phosphorylase
MIPQEEVHDLTGTEPVFTPRDFLHYVASMRGVDAETFRIPSRLIMVYQRRYFNFIDRLIKGKPVEWWWYNERLPLQVGSFRGAEIALATNFVGAPAAAMVFEELIACGASKVFEVGTAGGLQPFLDPGDIIIVTEALCDEGTSCQYPRGKRTSKPSSCLKQLIVEALDEKGVQPSEGPVLTTDGVYRETREKLARFRKAGVLAIDMETSALYNVAEHRGVEIASALVISDLLTDCRWQPAFGDTRVLRNVEILSRSAVRAVSKA